MDNTLTLLDQRVINGHSLYRTPLNPFFLSGIISLFIMCAGIIRNNALVGGHAQAEVWTPAAERIMLYCTRRPSALTTGLHGSSTFPVTEQTKCESIKGNMKIIWKNIEFN